MARPVPLLLALACAFAALCAGVDGGAGVKEGGAGAVAPPTAASGTAGGVTWLVQLSDLHLSAHAWPERCVIAAPCL